MKQFYKDNQDKNGDYHQNAEYEFYKIMNPKVEEMTEELSKVVPNKFWDTLNSMQEGGVAYHSIMVVLQCFCDTLFENLSSRDQNIVLWGALFHDISKRSNPVLEGKDHIHPFISAATTLLIFE